MREVFVGPICILILSNPLLSLLLLLLSSVSSAFVISALPNQRSYCMLSAHDTHFTHTTVYYTYYAFYSFIIIFPLPVSSSPPLSSYYLVLFFFNSKHTPYTVDNNSTTFTRSLEWKIGPSGVGSVYIK